MLIVMKKGAGEEQLRQVKQYLVDHDFDFHQSTGANRTIIGVIGDTGSVNRSELENLAGVHVIFKIPDEN
jgi:DAHP synthase ferredoxin-like domain